MSAHAKGAKWQNYARLARHRFCLEQCQRMSKIKAYIEYLFFQICHTFCTPRRAAKFVSKSVAGTLLGWSGWRLKAKAAKGWGLGAFNKVSYESYESYVYTFNTCEEKYALDAYHGFNLNKSLKYFEMCWSWKVDLNYLNGTNRHPQHWLMTRSIHAEFLLWHKQYQTMVLFVCPTCFYPY